MHEPVFVYHVPLPDGVSEIVLPCLDGHTVYIDDSLSHEAQIEAYRHATRHIKNRDFEKDNVQEIEKDARAKERREREKNY